MGGISKKSFIFLFISILSLALLLFFLILPTIYEIKSITNDLNSEQENLEMKSSLGQNIDKNIKELDIIKKSTYISESFISQGADLAFLQELEGYGEISGVEYDITTEEPTKNIKNEEKNIIINIKLGGDYPSLLRYLALLEKSKYYININSLSIKVDKSSAIETRNINPDVIESTYVNQKLIFTINATAYRR